MKLYTKPILALILLLVTALPTNAQLLWANKDNSGIQAFGIATDSAGNSYVTGGSKATSDDITTIKYNASGVRQWVATYNSPNGGTDVGLAIAVDTAGNSYITGWTKDSTALGYDIITLKYDTNGNQIWVKTYNGSANSADKGVAIAVDKALNVYVIGTSYGGSASNDDIVTIKYDPNGNQKWAKRYNGPGNGGDNARAISIDSVGNIFVTGESVGDNNTGWDVITIKYDPNGTRLWAKRFDNLPHGFDYGFALALDSANNIYITGSTYSSGSTGYDILLLKYDTNGNQKWQKKWAGTGTVQDFARNICVDSTGNIFVTGTTFNTSTRYDIVILKYNTNGSLIWARQYNGVANKDDYPCGIVADNKGGCYVAATVQPDASHYNPVLLKYDTAGNRQWVRRYPHNAYMNSLTADSAGNLFVTGIDIGSVNYLTLKFAP